MVYFSDMGNDEKKRKHILIIDDELEIINLLRGFLEENDFSIDAAEDGLKALACIENRIPDLVISDLLLPGEHGINVIKTIKQKYFIPVVIITGIYKREELKTLMEDYFVEAYFEKPLKLPVLLEVIRRILKLDAKPV